MAEVNQQRMKTIAGYEGTDILNAVISEISDKKDFALMQLVTCEKEQFEEVRGRVRAYQNLLTYFDQCLKNKKED